jgi:hypothetical protein
LSIVLPRRHCFLLPRASVRSRFLPTFQIDRASYGLRKRFFLLRC